MLVENPTQIPSEIVILSGVRGDTRRYRTFHPYEQLRLVGIPAILSHVTDPALPEYIKRSKIAIFHRVTYDRYIQSLFDSLLQQGGIPILDTDDLTFDPKAFQWINSSDFKDPVRAKLYQDNIIRNRQTLDACFGAITSTEFLADQIRSLGKTTWVHRNAYSLEMLKLSQDARLATHKSDSKVILGYASGTPTHDKDLDTIRPAIQQILQTDNRIELWLVGPLNPGGEWGEQATQIKQFPLVPWRDLPRILSQFDINLAPLVTDNPFTKAKSEIKYIEAALVGVPTIASLTPAFRHAINDGENGFLANNVNDWIEKINTLLDDKNKRHEIGECAYQDVLKNDHPLTRAKQLIKILEEIGSIYSGKSKQFQLKPAVEYPPEGYLSIKMEEHPTLIEMAHYTLRNRGVFTMLKEWWIYLRRMLAPIFPYSQKNHSAKL